MSWFVIEIETDGAAFAGDIGQIEELERILTELVQKSKNGGVIPGDYGSLRDINGNTVGKWKWEK